MKNVFSPANRLIKFNTKGFKTNQTHFYSGGYFGNCSGIKVCIFGGTSSIGTQIAANLLSIGTPVNIVHRNPFDVEIPYTHVRLLKQSNPFGGSTKVATDYGTTDDSLKNLRPYGEIGLKIFTYCPEIANEYDVEQAIKDCDVVINTIGPKPVIRHDEDYEEANVIIPRIIAKVCARQKNNPVKRLIHFSANGADPDSISRNLRTKWIGEQEIREYFPEATIIRPTEVLNHNIVNSFTG